MPGLPISFLPKELLFTVATCLTIKDLNSLRLASETVEKALFEAIGVKYRYSSFNLIFKTLQSRTLRVHKTPLMTYTGPLTYMEYRICNTKGSPPLYKFKEGVRVRISVGMDSTEYTVHKMSNLVKEFKLFSAFTCLDWRDACIKKKDPIDAYIDTHYLTLQTKKGPVILNRKALKGLFKFRNIQRLFLRFYSENNTHRDCAFSGAPLDSIITLVTQMWMDYQKNKIQIKLVISFLDHITSKTPSRACFGSGDLSPLWSAVTCHRFVIRRLVAVL